jgi:hypothetical protein
VVKTWKTYAENLTDAGVSWKFYQVPGGMTSVTKLFTAYQETPSTSPLYINSQTVPVGQFEYDALNDQLPTVSWLWPGAGQNEHPLEGTPAAGAQFIASKIDAIAANPEVWAKTVFIVVWVDHVVPPTPPAGTPDEFVTLNSPTGIPGGGPNTRWPPCPHPWHQEHSRCPPSRPPAAGQPPRLVKAARPPRTQIHGRDPHPVHSATRHSQAPKRSATARRRARESSREPVVDTLLQAGLTVFVIPPGQVKNLRSRCGSAGNKDDRFDAYVLADVVRTDIGRLRPMVCDSEQATALRSTVPARQDPGRPPGRRSQPAAGPPAKRLPRHRGAVR